ncbi:hypothetical protein F5X96DRAFT_171770 [Biscogniauxia mediterranea]|nr:hypothetical protein F5X96DRAFT_171770 [Biscogniauxia mediterranea]
MTCQALFFFFLLIEYSRFGSKTWNQWRRQNIEPPSTRRCHCYREIVSRYKKGGCSALRVLPFTDTEAAAAAASSSLPSSGLRRLTYRIARNMPSHTTSRVQLVMLRKQMMFNTTEWHALVGSLSRFV